MSGRRLLVRAHGCEERWALGEVLVCWFTRTCIVLLLVFPTFSTYVRIPLQILGFASARPCTGSSCVDVEEEVRKYNLFQSVYQ